MGKTKATKFEDRIRRIDRIEPDPPKIDGRYILNVVSGSIALTDDEYKELGSPEERTNIIIRIKNMESTS